MVKSMMCRVPQSKSWRRFIVQTPLGYIPALHACKARETVLAATEATLVISRIVSGGGGPSLTCSKASIMISSSGRLSVCTRISLKSLSRRSRRLLRFGQSFLSHPFQSPCLWQADLLGQVSYINKQAKSNRSDRFLQARSPCEDRNGKRCAASGKDSKPEFIDLPGSSAIDIQGRQ